MEGVYNENGLTHKANADRLEELFSAALQSLFDIEDCITSPTEIKHIIKDAWKEFERINNDFLTEVQKRQR